MADMRSIFYQLEYLGLSDVILPFILIFTITWAVLKKMKLFEDKKVSIIIALALALGVVIPHATGTYPVGADIVEIINTAVPQVAGVIIAVVMLLIMIGVWNVESDWDPAQYAGGIIVILSMLIVGWIFVRATGWLTYSPWWLMWLEDPVNQALIVALLVAGLIIWFITSETNAGSPGESIIKEFGKLFKKRERSGGTP